MIFEKKNVSQIWQRCIPVNSSSVSFRQVHTTQTPASHLQRMVRLVHGHLLLIGDNISIYLKPLYRATLFLHYTRDRETDQLMLRSWQEWKVQDKDRILCRFISIVQTFQEQKIQIRREHVSLTKFEYHQWCGGNGDEPLFDEIKMKSKSKMIDVPQLRLKFENCSAWMTQSTSVSSVHIWFSANSGNCWIFYMVIQEL